MCCVLCVVLCVWNKQTIRLRVDKYSPKRHFCRFFLFRLVFVPRDPCLQVADRSPPLSRAHIFPHIPLPLGSCLSYYTMMGEWNGDSVILTVWSFSIFTLGAQTQEFFLCFFSGLSLFPSISWFCLWNKQTIRLRGRQKFLRRDNFCRFFLFRLGVCPRDPCLQVADRSPFAGSHFPTNPSHWGRVLSYYTMMGEWNGDW